MPLPNKKPVAAKKPAGRKLSDLNLPDGGSSSLLIGDAQRTKCDDWFDSDTAEFSYTSFDILGAENSHYQDKETVLFLVKSNEDGEKYYFWMPANDTRKAFVTEFESDDTPILNCGFQRIPGKQAKPFMKIVDMSEIETESDVDF